MTPRTQYCGIIRANHPDWIGWQIIDQLDTTPANTLHRVEIQQQLNYEVKLLKQQPMKFEIKPSSSGEFYFTLKAANGEVIATSEMYTTKPACRKGINAVKKSLFATVIDLTK